MLMKPHRDGAMDVGLSNRSCGQNRGSPCQDSGQSTSELMWQEESNTSSYLFSQASGSFPVPLID